jgi:ABC-type Mn2+/Zn2+ transport system ATPase subunit
MWDLHDNACTVRVGECDCAQVQEYVQRIQWLHQDFCMRGNMQARYRCFPLSTLRGPEGRRR